MGQNMRLPFFPIPAKGETVFSVIGRCSERLGISNHELMVHLTGQQYIKTLFSSLPSYLANIAAAMPEGHPWQDINTIIYDHTAFPYFTYFHPHEKKLNSAKMLTTSYNNHPIIVGMGLSMYRTPATPKNPRFCLKCMNEQLIDHGYAFFQVPHQLPGVSVCWKHNEVLFDGCINCGPYPLKRKKLTMPGQCLCSSFEAQTISTEIIADKAKWIAENSSYILSSKSCEDNHQTEKLRKGILQSDICKGTLVDYTKLAKTIETRFNRKFLTSIGYPVWENDKPSAWLRRFFSHGKSNRQLSTISGILILGASYESIQDFENETIINQYKSQPISINGNEEQPEPWKSSLAQTLKDHHFLISSCAATLNKTPWAVSKEALNQNISVPLSPSTVERIGDKNLKQIITKLKNGTQKKKILNEYQIGEWTLILIELSVPHIRKINKKKAEQSIQLKHRKAVQDLLQRAPGSTRSDIMQQLPGSYDYLISNDKTWFQNSIPKAARKISTKRTTRLNWQKIDNELAVAIKETTRRILNNDKKPQRITASYLLSQHAHLQRYHTNQSKFPKTSEVLNAVTESKEQHLFRKVTWGVKKLIQAEQEISIDNLRRTCSVSQYRLQPHLNEIRNLIYSLGGNISNKSKLFE